MGILKIKRLRSLTFLRKETPFVTSLGPLPFRGCHIANKGYNKTIFGSRNELKLTLLQFGTLGVISNQYKRTKRTQNCNKMKRQ